MRALWLVRSDLEDNPGGDTTQILETASALRARGVSIQISSTADPDLDSHDIVHLFHLDRVWENAHWCRLIRNAGIPSVLSPIYWPSEEFDRHGRSGLGGAVTRLAGASSYQNLKLVHHAARPLVKKRDMRTIRSALFGYEFGRRFLIETVQAILPNSWAERSQLCERFPSHPTAVVVPNAVNQRTFPSRSDIEREKDTVLCVGRIEPRKNQLSLIRALRGSGLKLRIIGRAGDFNRSYERQCRRAGGSEVEFLSWTSGEELQRWYHSSAVHVSPSWYETPGLASLEAAYCGCPLVVTPRGSTREYFDDDAEYCEPDDEASIRAAVERARDRASSPSGVRLSERIASSFTWDVAAEQTLTAYEIAAKPKSDAQDGRWRVSGNGSGSRNGNGKSRGNGSAEPNSEPSPNTGAPRDGETQPSLSASVSGVSRSKVAQP